MSSNRKDSFSEAIVGVFMLAVLALLVYFTVIVSGVDVFGSRKMVSVDVAFEDVGGLKEHDHVMYRGTKVGSVERIILGEKVLTVRLEIDRNVILREGYRIAVCNLSMLGGNYLVLEEGSGEILSLETHAFIGEKPSDWMRDIASIARNINAITSGGELKTIVTNLAQASVSVRAATDRINRGEGTLGKLLSSDTRLYDGLEASAANIAAISRGLKDGRGTLGKLLADDSVHEDLKKTLNSASEIARRLESSEGFLGKLLAKDDPFYADLSSAVAAFKKASESFDAKAVMASATNLLENLNVVASRLSNSEGTLGKLISDKALYEEVSGLTKDVRQVIDNYRDTTPITTFGSLIMGGL